MVEIRDATALLPSPGHISCPAAAELVLLWCYVFTSTNAGNVAVCVAHKQSIMQVINQKLTNMIIISFLTYIY